MLENIIAKDHAFSQRLRIVEQDGWLRRTAAFLAHSGDSWFWALGLVLLWLFGSPFWKHWAAVQFGAISIMAAIVMTVKFTVKRRRPAGEWGLLYRSTDPHSFPSGHAARVFLLAMLSAFLGPAWLAALLWIWAPLVALARVGMGVHYLSDILAGMLLGILGGVIAWQIYPTIYHWYLGWSHFPLW